MGIYIIGIGKCMAIIAVLSVIGGVLVERSTVLKAIAERTAIGEVLQGNIYIVEVE